MLGWQGARSTIILMNSPSRIKNHQNRNQPGLSATPRPIWLSENPSGV
jgi:hypothetical protein